MRYEGIHPAVYAELHARIAAVEDDLSLVEPENFFAREVARTGLEKEVIGRIEQLIDSADKGEKKRLRALKRQASSAASFLDQVNDGYFAAVRERIRSGDYPKTAFSQTLHSYVERCEKEEWNDPPQYDHLDTFVDGILQIGLLPRGQRAPEAEMVYYQPTPARIVLDMVERLSLSPADVLYDLGSGLGRVVNIVALVGNGRAIGVEFEPAYCAYARRRAAELSLVNARFINADARDVNYVDGTVFFLYTPFKGKILHRVLELLRYEARTRRIRVCTYGPGTLEMLGQEWLVPVDESEPTIHRVAIFENRRG